MIKKSGIKQLLLFLLEILAPKVSFHVSVRGAEPATGQQPIRTKPQYRILTEGACTDDSDYSWITSEADCQREPVQEPFLSGTHHPMARRASCLGRSVARGAPKPLKGAGSKPDFRDAQLGRRRLV